MAPEADLRRVLDGAPLDLFYAFWLPASRALPAWAVWLVGGLVSALLAAVPLLTRPAASDVPPRSIVDESICTGCTQCSLDCPYEAIAMLPRHDGRAERVARVDPEVCVSCGICAGSCAPMGVGPPGRTGRDQVARVRTFLDERAPGPRDVVLIACDRGAGGVAGSGTFEGAAVFGIPCAGSLHTSVIELLVRGGAGGVLVVSCPPRDCWNREGPTWLVERVHHDREAELQARVDRRRVRLAAVAAADTAEVRRLLSAFRGEIEALDTAEAEEDPRLDPTCDAELEPAGAPHGPEAAR